jgi:hypothetical protein
MTVQSLASVIRQVVAIAAVVMGALTASLAAIKLPTAVSAVLAAAGAVILAIEHYVGDPSTGTPTPAQPVIKPAGTNPVQPSS